jgi:hypothetical protein
VVAEEEEEEEEEEEGGGGKIGVAKNVNNIGKMEAAWTFRGSLAPVVFALARESLSLAPLRLRRIVHLTSFTSFRSTGRRPPFSSLL